ncbi:hypothetical protein J2741_000368 [Methanolinea mesophila]|uniref:hypothetical protein n=1 Tax=Methanolinea mesophila TaxID=547055 RepID=UPI001AEB695C|nr:hypothetical protein [Methanolinea mesophila]MBP1927821.1 hypothetical protein [Methanolinea mesophila]
MKDEEIRDKCSSLVLPHLEPLLKVIYRLFTRYGIEVPLEFGLSIIFLIFTIIIYITGSSEGYIVFFSSLAIIILIASNWNLIRDLIKDRFILKKIPAVTNFFRELENRSVNDVQKFLRDYRNLSVDNLKNLINSKFFSYSAVQLSIVKYQRISGELLEYIVNNGFDHKININVWNKYVYFTADDISENTYYELLNRYKNKQIIKAVQVNFPLYAKKRSILISSAIYRLKIRDWFRYGAGNLLIGTIALILAGYALSEFVKGNTPLQSSYLESFGVYGVIFFWINIVMGFSIIFGIFMIIQQFIIIAFLKIFKYSLYILAPSSVNS